jgi:hypothetical protein
MVSTKLLKRLAVSSLGQAIAMMPLQMRGLVISRFLFRSMCLSLDAGYLNLLYSAGRGISTFRPHD